MGFSRKSSQPRDVKFPTRLPDLPASAPDEMNNWWTDAQALLKNDHQRIEDALAALKNSISGQDQSSKIKELQDEIDALRSEPVTTTKTEVTNVTQVTGDTLTKDQKDALKGTFGSPDDANRYVTSTDPRFGAIGQSNVPAGTVIDYAGGAVPNGWLLCDGSEVIRSGYAALFAAIGTTYGIGDGAATFNLPDCRGRSSIGAGSGPGLTARALGASFGEEAHILSGVESGLPVHSHTVPWRDNSCAGGSDNNTGSMTSGPLGSVVTSTAGPLAASQGHNTVHPVITFTRLIKF